ncbi:MAG: hypothetical protein ACSHYA_03780 [Opitutaceae bacterium]
MDYSSQQKQRDRLLLIFWSLLFVKCFTLEFLVVRYDVPINSIAYVWSLSIFMASVATLVKYRIEKRPSSNSGTFPMHKAIWLTCLISITLLHLIDLWRNHPTEAYASGISAVFMGLGYCSQALLLKQLVPLLCGFAWWIGAAAIFRLENPEKLLAFAICTLLLTTLPTLSAYIKNRSKPQTATEALEQ